MGALVRSLQEPLLLLAARGGPPPVDTSELADLMNAKKAISRSGLLARVLLFLLETTVMRNVKAPSGWFASLGVALAASTAFGVISLHWDPRYQFGIVLCCCSTLLAGFGGVAAGEPRLLYLSFLISVATLGFAVLLHNRQRRP